MKSSAKIGIKYCGGCNPKYDRVSFASKVKEVYSDYEVKSANSSEMFDCVVVVSGCHAACASLKDINTRKGFIIVRENKLDETLKHINMSLNGDNHKNEIFF